MVGVAADELVVNFEDFLSEYHREDVLELADKYPSERQSIEVDLLDLYQWDPDLHDDLVENPDTVMETAETALGNMDVTRDLEGATIRPVNMPDPHVYNVGDTRAHHLGRLIAIRGQVAKKTKARTVLTEVCYECQRCATKQRIHQPTPDERIEPHECNGCERKGPFRMVDDECEFENEQMIRLQVPPEMTRGRADETIDIRLYGDLVDTVEPGDRAKAIAPLGLEPVRDGSNICNYYAEAEGIEVDETDFEDLDWREYEDRIIEIAQGDPIEDLIDSMAPKIRGHRDEKLAILCALFGGVEKEFADGSNERGDSHVLLVGDPGVGKSRMLSYADDLAPRSIFTDGKGSSSAGLTASAVRDDFGAGGEWSIEGGAVVKAHKGLAAIDELDDMDPEDRSALHTALEKQEVPVSKAGITTTLPAKTTLVAAANPKYGRFDVYEPISQQIDLDPALISRFDLIFVMTDAPDPERDLEIIDHKAKASFAGQRRASGNDVPDEIEDQISPEIDKEVLRAYIAFAKQNVTPQFSDQALERVKKEFLDLRLANDEAEKDPDEEPVPITFRKQEAITRLSEALARMRLSDTVEVSDVRRAMDLVESTLQDVGMDPDTGELDADRMESNTSRSQRDRIYAVRDIIEELCSDAMDHVAGDRIVDEAMAEGYSRREIESTIEKLLKRGDIYEPETGHYNTT